MPAHVPLMALKSAGGACAGYSCHDIITNSLKY